MRIIIVGAGKVGYALARHLADDNNDVVVIEENEERREIIQNNLDVMTLGGNGASVANLLEAGIKEAGMLIAVTASDEVNMIACMTAKRLGVGRTIARIRNEDYAQQGDISISKTLGIDVVINPELVTAMEINKILSTPSSLDIEDFADGKVRMLEVKMRPTSKIIEIPLRELVLPKHILVAGILRNHKMIIPRGQDVLQAADHVFFLGETETVKNFEKNFIMTRSSKLNKVFIIGAGRVGRYLAVMLEQAGFDLKIIDNDKGRCELIAGQLKNSMVLLGDAADKELLVEEGIAQADAVICLTEDDKLNMLAALLTKNLGAERTFVKVGRVEYIPIMDQIGIDVTFTPQLITAGTILRMARSDDILSMSLIEGDQAEAMEILLTANSPIIDKQLKDLKIPTECLVGAIIRNEQVIVPTGDDYLLIGDRIVVFALHNIAKKVLAIFKGRR